ncbi:tol [Fusarium mexicanum]|uniref:Tol n=1 Tax=Fusarium mexicanum TaxID=751941 RepID=A0A8H5IBP4_9HYPO|nr:tol [Fusarium mexicanum]
MAPYLSVVDPSRLCPVCDMALRSNILCVSLPHHKSGLDLEKASDLGCYICGTIRHSNTWSRRIGECRSSSFEYVLNLHNAGFMDTLEGLIIGKAPTGCCWAFQLWKDPDPSCFSISYKPSASPYDSGFIRLAKNWLDSCCQTHVKCRKSGPDYKPTRLIEIIDELRVRLIFPKNLSFGPIDYIAFSHCWGKVEAIKLLKENVDRFRLGISIHDLPNTYQEAIQLSLRMGFRYIWIDSLCIIQDSSLDWMQEAKDMKRVYEHAIFNLCSATASDSAGTSFVARHTSLLRPLHVKVHGEVFQMLCDGLLQDDITYCTLRTRAWVYQEWYLSKRSLVMGSHQLWWHCKEKLACELWPIGTPQANRGRWWSQTQPLKESAPSEDSDDMDAWSQRVMAYMRTRLTRETDRLVAFSGVVQSFGQTRQLTEDYLAGLWRCHLPAALLWKVSSSARRSATYTAASWSWASLAGDCLVSTDKDLAHEPCFITVKQMMSLGEPGPDGFLMGGVITLRGYLFEVVYRSVGLFLGRGDFMIPGDQMTGGELYLDEGSESDSLISHLEAPDLNNFSKWLENKAVRRAMPLKDAKGRFYFLLFLDRGDEYRFRFRGLILYQPIDQSESFYRVRYMNWGKLPGVVNTDELMANYTKSTVRIL